LQAAYAELRFELPSRAIHGDPHRKNLVRAGDGSIMLLDLERFSLGPPEWDLVIPVVYRQVGWYTTVDYAAFCEAYGWDVTTWAGCATLARVRRLRMTTWLAARTGREPRLIPEVLHRVETLRDQAAHRHWVPGT
jgi:aminoglycoside phosphotransferase (APT) family kinase protein